MIFISHPIFLTIHAVLAFFCVRHALLKKRSSRAAFGWIILVISVPIVGAGIYLIFGLNRVWNRSRKLTMAVRSELGPFDALEWDSPADEAEAKAAFTEHEWRMLRAGRKIAKVPLRPGNLVKPLHNGEQAYPPMLEAIRNARSYVWLTTYIFETNEVGMEFVKELIKAHERRVDVRVIIDGVGELYFWPLAGKKLREAGVPLVRYLPPKVGQFMVNLRNHRKLLVVDDVVAFTGGMNIGGRHMVSDEKGSQVHDIHFLLEGPIIEDFKRVFHYDWVFGSFHDGRLPSRGGLDRLTSREDDETPRLPAPRTRSAIDLATAGDHARLASVVEATAAGEDAPLLEATTRAMEEQRRETAAHQAELLEKVRRSDAATVTRAKQIADGEKNNDYDAWYRLLKGSSAEEVSQLATSYSSALADDEKNSEHDAWCRLITGGPVEEVSQLETIYSSVLAAADRRILLVTPYFLPTEAIETSLVNAALRGVDVTVLVPEKTNQPLVHAAMFRSIGWMISRGVKVKMQRPPFAHTKLLLIDDRYVHVGSANMDPRSLRLNFELSVEIMDESLVQQLEAYYAPVLERARLLTNEELNARPWWKKVWYGFVWLFSPYL